MQSFRLSLFLRCALLMLPVVMTACSDFDWFDEKKTPLAGDRKPVFPGGVPGVTYNAPPLQPSNSNIPIDTQLSNTGQNQPAADPGSYEKDQPATRTKSSTARNVPQGEPRQPQPQQPPRAAAQPAADDPWADSRTAN
jgi:hypothetical protein